MPRQREDRSSGPSFSEMPARNRREAQAGERFAGKKWAGAGRRPAPDRLMRSRIMSTVTTSRTSQQAVPTDPADPLGSEQAHPVRRRPPGPPGRPAQAARPRTRRSGTRGIGQRRLHLHRGGVAALQPGHGEVDHLRLRPGTPPHVAGGPRRVLRTHRRSKCTGWTRRSERRAIHRGERTLRVAASPAEDAHERESVRRSMPSGSACR